MQSIWIRYRDCWMERWKEEKVGENQSCRSHSVSSADSNSLAVVSRASAQCLACGRGPRPALFAGTVRSSRGGPACVWHLVCIWARSSCATEGQHPAVSKEGRKEGRKEAKKLPSNTAKLFAKSVLKNVGRGAERASECKHLRGGRFDSQDFGASEWWCTSNPVAFANKTL